MIEMDRRSLLKAGGSAALMSVAEPSIAAAKSRRFPRRFRWGAATAAHQIEGNNINSDLWAMETVKPETFKDHSGDADDSYHRWNKDVQLLKTIGLNTYRFSVEWARIEPIPGQFSLAALDHYKRCIEMVRAAGIAPVVTFFHFSAPRWFAEKGGWLSPDSPSLFANYCDKVARALADGIAYACTLNEPQVGLTFRAIPQAEAYFKAEDDRQRAAHQAAARKYNVPLFATFAHPSVREMQPQMMAAHQQGYAAIRAVRGDLPTGVTLSMVDFQPGNEGSQVEPLRELAYGAWLDTAKTGEFIGTQVYQQMRIPGAGAPLPPPPAMPFVQPGDMQESLKQPVALKNIVEYVHRRTGKPIFVTENGLETDVDERRAWYIPQVLSQLHDAITGGVPVIGYLHWSLLDNFEWHSGYRPKFGLTSVDRTTFKRTLKPSAAVYGHIARRNAL